MFHLKSPEVAVAKSKKTPPDDQREAELRIIGGKFRASKLAYQGDGVTRPMKHRVREAIFNLVGMEAKEKHVYDIFAGSGALGLEALSRGAARATFIERHIPGSRIVEQNVASLGVGDRCDLLVTSAFLWSKRDLPNMKVGDVPWLVFVCPPYAFYIDRQEEMLTLVEALQQYAPPGSTIVVESDERFDFQLFGSHDAQATWDVRTYPPAVVGVWRKLA